ncbi:MAG TPA: hypothetical protein V6D43_16540 [Candidatus Sericytochromatia bacterium]|jgi:hypothetical protein
MFSREDKKLTNSAIWLTLDFKKVKQRVNEITEQLEAVRGKPTPQIEAGDYIDPEDYAKLREFMKDNQLSESKAIAVILNAFFKGTAKASSKPPNPLDEAR